MAIKSFRHKGLETFFESGNTRGIKALNMTTYNRTRQPVHPGRILNEDVLAELDINVTQAARMLGVSRKHLSNFVNEQVDCSVEMAQRLAIATKTSVESWMNMQHAVNIWRAQTNTTAFDDVEVFS